MKYNFDEVIDRSANRSSKYDERVKKFGTADVIPLWVADMDFRTAQPIIDACKKKAEEGIWGYTSRPARDVYKRQDGMRRPGTGGLRLSSHDDIRPVHPKDSGGLQQKAGASDAEGQNRQGASGAEPLCILL